MIKLSDFERTLIKEISTISDQSELAIREVLEYTLLRQAEQLLNGEPIIIPFLGELSVQYDGDDFEAGNRVARVKATFVASDLLKRLIGDVEDGESSILEDLLASKMKVALQQQLNKDRE